VKAVLVTSCAVALAVSAALMLVRHPAAPLAVPTGEAKPPLGDQVPEVTLEDASPPRSAVAETAESTNRPEPPRFEEKYAGASMGQLLGAEWTLTEKYKREGERIAKELVAQNRLTVVAPGESSGPRTTASHPTMSFVSVFGDANGTPTAKSARIGGDAYPEYDALELELGWLHQRVYKLRREQAATPK